MRKSDKKTKQAIISKIKAALPKTQREKAGKLAPSILAGVPLEDLESQPTERLAKLLLSAQSAVAKANRRTLEVSQLDGDSALITMTMSNRPFIVDSVLAECRRHEIDIELVAHPIIGAKGKDAMSLVLVIATDVDDDERRSLRRGLETVRDQIRLVTDDWQKMLLRVDAKIGEFRSNPPDVPEDELFETIQFLEWLVDNNFTFLGLRDYVYEGDRENGELKPLGRSALGILRDRDLAVMTRGGRPVSLTPEIRHFLFNRDALFVTKANARARVHRNTHLDYIGIKRYASDGSLAGEMRIVGLFTSTAYTKSVMTIPLLRRKAQHVLAAFSVDRVSHDGRALMNILEDWPRDELFQLDLDTLTEFSDIVLKLEERQRIRVLPRVDRFDRFVSIVVFVPRDRYDSIARRRIGAYLAAAYDGYLSAFYPSFLQNGLARIHFVIGRTKGKTPVIRPKKLETEITDIVRTWDDKLRAAGGTDVQRHHFPVAYQDSTSAGMAIEDTAHLDNLAQEDAISVGLRKVSGDQVELRLFHLESAVPLSQRVPMLENLGFSAIEESTFEIVRADGRTVFLHDMILKPPFGDSDLPVEALVETLLAIWAGETENDNFNGLVLAAGMNWREASVFRAYARYLRQIKSGFTVHSMAQTLARYPTTSRALADLFALRFDPGLAKHKSEAQDKRDEIAAAIEKIESSEDDNIMRNFLNMILSTLRTNHFSPALEAPGTEAAPTPVLAFKFDPANIRVMPQPAPYREIFVSSPRVEGLHLRFGPVARGGLRWSDRAQDYRTEVLGLVKAQQVKNAVIVPVGSKGGFLPRQLPVGGDRSAIQTEGREAYKIYISSLLSLTDNIEGTKITAPKKVVRYDGDDPYFVVAADKGTATFSDTANAVSQENNFWLDDAFASGGSAGYDHKVMGITAKGGWEAVKRHFREMDRDIQTQPFTAIGVGDMSGDVFGNGMLLSKKTRLVAAFDHRDIFIDPDPDIDASYKERKRLFDVGRSSWQDYRTDVISRGGGVWPRSSKRIKLPAAAAAAIGADAGTYTPQEVMRLILKAPADLLWFGGIGTYVRASRESDADVGDRSNDTIRVASRDLRVKVIGEGANLGVTQPGRIEFNRNGGRCNSDAIDNSAGVNSSDVEVNIKIALASAMKAGRLSRKRRNTLLDSMTDTVSQLVLRNNYLQTLAISLTERQGMTELPYQQRLIHELEERGRLDRAVEDLPDDAELAERTAAGQPLTRAETGVLLAYAKIVALDDIVESNLPDDPYLEDILFSYFPPKMHGAYAADIRGHRLRREIIGTLLVNSMINRGGPTLVSRVVDRTGVRTDIVARAYIVVRSIFDMPNINAAIDALDNKITGDIQLELYGVLQEQVLAQAVWFARYGDFSKGIGSVIQDFQKPIAALIPKLERIVPGFLAERIGADRDRYVEAGVPGKLALTIARMPIAALIPDVVLAAKTSGKKLDAAVRVFFAITELFRVGRIVQAARGIGASDYYDSLALDRALQSLHRARRDIVIDVLKGGADVDKWLGGKAQAVEQAQAQMHDVIETDQISVSRLTVAANVLADLARS